MSRLIITTRKIQLLHNIYSALCAIAKIWIIDDDKRIKTMRNVKSIMYSLVELFTDERPEKF